MSRGPFPRVSMLSWAPDGAKLFAGHCHSSASDGKCLRHWKCCTMTAASCGSCHSSASDGKSAVRHSKCRTMTAASCGPWGRPGLAAHLIKTDSGILCWQAGAQGAQEFTASPRVRYGSRSGETRTQCSRPPSVRVGQFAPLAPRQLFCCRPRVRALSPAAQESSRSFRKLQFPLTSTWTGGQKCGWLGMTSSGSAAALHKTDTRPALWKVTAEKSRLLRSALTELSAAALLRRGATTPRCCSSSELCLTKAGDAVCVV